MQGRGFSTVAKDCASPSVVVRFGLVWFSRLGELRMQSCVHAAMHELASLGVVLLHLPAPPAAGAAHTG